MENLFLSLSLDSHLWFFSTKFAHFVLFIWFSVKSQGLPPWKESNIPQDLSLVTLTMASKPVKSSNDPIKHLAERYGLTYNQAGELREINLSTKQISERPFVYDVFHGDMRQNQRRYEAIAALVTEIVYNQMIKEGLIKVKFRSGSFFFVSEVSKYILCS